MGPGLSPVRIFDRVRKQLGDYKRQDDCVSVGYENVPTMNLTCVAIPVPQISTKPSRSSSM